MKKLIKYFDKRIKRLNIWDLKFLGWACLMIGLLLATILPILTKVPFVIYLVLAILLAIKPYYKLLKK